jgi:hypothetical protein
VVEDNYLRAASRNGAHVMEQGSVSGSTCKGLKHTLKHIFVQYRTKPEVKPPGIAHKQRSLRFKENSNDLGTKEGS